MSRQALLKRVPKAVEINGESILIRSLTLREAMTVDAMSKDPTQEQSVLSYMVSRAVVDANGSPLFAADDPEVNDIPIDTLREIGTAIKKMANPGSVDKAEKN